MINNKQNPNVSDAAKNFMELCLKVDPNERLTIEQALKHDWLQEGRNVKLKYVPAACREGDFNPDSFATTFSKFCNYQGSIAEHTVQLKNGVIKSDDIPVITVPPVEKPKIAVS